MEVVAIVIKNAISNRTRCDNKFF